MIPPLLVILRIGRLWLPLPTVLLWPLLTAALFIAPAVLPLVPVTTLTRSQRAALPFHVWRLLSAARGLRVDVSAHDGRSVHLRVW
ncbi:MAG: hypothetical protein ACOC7T_02120 [Planctomycetota bacterium]